MSSVLTKISSTKKTRRADCCPAHVPVQALGVDLAPGGHGRSLLLAVLRGRLTMGNGKGTNQWTFKHLRVLVSPFPAGYVFNCQRFFQGFFLLFFWLWLKWFGLLLSDYLS